MLKLINIKNNNGIIEADYVPESGSKKARVSLNIQTGEGAADNIEDYGIMYQTMALNGLKRISKELYEKKIEEVPKERIVMWY